MGSPTVPFSVNGSEAGEMQSYGPLVFLKVSLAIRSLHLYDYLIELHNLNRIFLLKQVYNAGHLVPMDQPQASLEMLIRWMQGKLATT